MMQDIIVLVKPTEEYAYDARKYKNDCIELDGVIHGGGGLAEFDNYTNWLQFLKEKEDGKNMPRGIVSSETYFAVHDQDDRIIGMVDIRKTLNEQLLQEGGNIGISVRPCYRGEGYGTMLLNLALKRCRELGLTRVLVVCKEENLRAANLLLSNGGKEEKMAGCPEDLRRFWIAL